MRENNRRKQLTCFQRKSQYLVTTSSDAEDQQNDQPSRFGERLTFAIWLAGKVLGVDSDKDFAEAIGKRQSQLSRWLREDPRPAWSTIKQIADAVQISALWLDDPAALGASEPAEFPQWLANRRARAARVRDVASSANALKDAMQASANAPRGAQLEPKDVPAANPRKKPETDVDEKKRAG